MYELAAERELVVRSLFDDGPDCLEIVSARQATRVPKQLADRLAIMRDQVALEQLVRLRLLRRLPASA